MPQASNMNGGTYELGLLSSRVNHYPTAPAAVLFARRDLSLSRLARWLIISASWRRDADDSIGLSMLPSSNQWRPSCRVLISSID